MTDSLIDSINKYADENCDPSKPREARRLFVLEVIAIIRQHTAAPDVASALKHLVALKIHKEEHGETDHYKEMKPIAWDNAKAAIAAMNMRGIPGALLEASSPSGEIPVSPLQASEIRLIQDDSANWKDGEGYCWLRQDIISRLMERHKPEPVELSDIGDSPEAMVLQKILDALGIDDVNINSRGLFEGWIRGVSKPVTVSLMDCAMALQGNERIKLGSDLQAIAKSVLEAAGVDHVD